MLGFTAEQMDACGKHEYQPESCPVCADDAELEQRIGF